MPKLRKSLKKMTVEQVQTLALEDATEHLLDTVYIYTSMFIDMEGTREQEEVNLRNMINARLYLDSVLSTTL